MSIYKIVDRMTRYLACGVSRLFSPSDDAYPTIGVQPFSGAYQPRHSVDW